MDLVKNAYKMPLDNALMLGAGIQVPIQNEILNIYQNTYILNTSLNAEQLTDFLLWSGLSNARIAPSAYSYSQEHSLARAATNYCQHLAIRMLPQHSRVLFIGSTFAEALHVRTTRPDLLARFQIDTVGMKQETRLSKGLAAAEAIRFNPLSPDFAFATDYVNAISGAIPLGAHFTFGGLNEIPPTYYNYIIAIDSILYYSLQSLETLVKRCRSPFGPRPTILAATHFCAELFTIGAKSMSHPVLGWKWVRETIYGYMSHMSTNTMAYKTPLNQLEALWCGTSKFSVDALFSNWGYGLISLSLHDRGEHMTMQLAAFQQWTCFCDSVTYYQTGRRVYYMVQTNKLLHLTDYMYQRFISVDKIEWGTAMQYVRSTMGKVNMIGRDIVGVWNFDENTLAGVIIAHCIVLLSITKTEMHNTIQNIIAFKKTNFKIGLFRRFFSWNYNAFIAWITGPLSLIYKSELEEMKGFYIGHPITTINNVAQLGKLVVDFSKFLGYSIHVGGRFDDPRDTEDNHRKFKREICGYTKERPMDSTNHCPCKLATMLSGYQGKNRILYLFGFEPGYSVQDFLVYFDRIVCVFYTEGDGKTKFPIGKITLDPRVSYISFTSWGLIPKEAVILYDVSCCNGLHYDSREVCPNPFIRLNTMITAMDQYKNLSTVYVKFNSNDWDKWPAIVSSEYIKNVHRPIYQNEFSFELYFELQRNKADSIFGWFFQSPISEQWRKHMYKLLEKPMEYELAYYQWLQSVGVAEDRALLDKVIADTKPLIDFGDVDDDAFFSSIGTTLDPVASKTIDEEIREDLASERPLVKKKTAKILKPDPMEPCVLNDGLGEFVVGMESSEPDPFKDLLVENSSSDEDEVIDTTPALELLPPAGIPFKQMSTLLSWLIYGLSKDLSAIAPTLCGLIDSGDYSGFAACGYGLTLNGKAISVKCQRKISVFKNSKGCVLTSLPVTVPVAQSFVIPKDLCTLYTYWSMPPDGFCFWRALSIMLYKTDRMMPSVINLYKVNTTFDFPYISRITTTQVLELMAKLGLPIARSDGEAAKMLAGTYPAFMIFNGSDHIDLVVNNKVYNCGVNPELKLKPVSFFNIDWEVALQAKSSVIFSDFLKYAAVDPSSEYYAIHSGVVKIVNSYVGGRIKPSPVHLVQGGPGCTKTESVIKWWHQEKTKRGSADKKLLFVAASRDQKSDTMLKFVKQFSLKGHDQVLPNAGVHVKTFIHAMSPNFKEMFTHQNPELVYIFIDECHTHILHYYAVLSHCYPHARLILIGDVNQLGFDEQMYSGLEAPMMSMSVSSLFKAYPLLNSKQFVTQLNTTFRFGPELVHIANRLVPGAKLKSGIYKPFKIRRLPLGALGAVKDAGFKVITASVKNLAPDKALGISTVRQAQGCTLDTTFIHLEDTIQLNNFNYLKTLYVAITRATTSIVIISTLEHYKQFLSLVKIPGAEQDAYVGGPVDEFDADLHMPQNFGRDKTKIPAVHLKKAAIPKTSMAFDDLKDYLVAMPNGNTAFSTAAAVEIADIKANLVNCVPIDKTIDTMTETVPGIRNWVSSPLQDLAAVAHRLIVNKAAERKAKMWKHSPTVIKENFFHSFVNKTKYDAIWNEPAHYHLTSECITEFRSVLNMDDISAESSMIQFYRSAREHLKTQTRMKGLDVTLKGKLTEELPKTGQPIVAMEKLINLEWSPIFRFIVKAIQFSLKSNVIWASGATEYEYAKRFNEHANWNDPMIMADYPEMDTNHTNVSNKHLILLYKCFVPDDDLIDKYFVAVTYIPIHARMFSYWLVSQLGSGRPDTFTANCALQMIDMVVSGMAGPYKESWFDGVHVVIFGGDDSTKNVTREDLFDMSVLEPRMVGKMKMKVKRDGTMEFFNWIFTQKGCYYNPITLCWKILGKSYANILSNEDEFLEYIESLCNLMYGYWHNLPIAAIDIATYLELDYRFIQRLLLLLAGVIYKTRKEFAASTMQINCSDYLIGGVIDTDSFHTVEKMRSMTPNINMIKEKISQKDSKIRCMTFDPKIQLNPGARGDLQTYSLLNSIALPTFCDETKTGPDHNPTFSMTGHHNGNAVKVTDGPTKKDTQAMVVTMLARMLPKVNPTVDPEVESECSLTIGEPANDLLFKALEIRVDSLSRELNDIRSNVSFETTRVNHLYEAFNSVDYILNSFLELITNDSVKSVIQKSWNALMHALNGNIQDLVEFIVMMTVCCMVCAGLGYVCFLSIKHNRLMHSLNGNPKGRPIETLVAQEKLLNKKLGKMELRTKNKKGKQRPRQKHGKTGVHFTKATHKHAIGRGKERKADAHNKWLANVDMKPKPKLAMQIARSLCLPEEGNVVRYAAPYSVEPTAIAAPYTEPYTAWSLNPALASRQLSATDLMAVVTRTPEAALILYDFNPGNAAWQYNLTGGNVNASGLPLPPSQSFNVPVATGVFTAIPLLYGIPAVAGGYSPHGTTWFSGSYHSSADPNQKWFWVNATDAFTCTIATIDSSVTGYLVIDYFDGTSYVAVSEVGPAQTYTTTPTTASLTFEKGAYASVNFYTESIVTYNVDVLLFTNVYIKGNTDNFCHTCIPYFDYNCGSVPAIRVLNASLRYTNRASELNAQGTIAMTQSYEGKPWTSYIANNGTGYKAVTSSKVHFTGPLNKGAYGFLKPEDSKTFNFVSNTKTSGGNIMSSGWEIDQQASYLIAYAQCTNALGMDGFWVATYGVEYETSDSWRSVKAPNANSETWAMAMQMVLRTNQFHENPSHLEEIWDSIKGVGDAVAPIIGALI